MNLLEAGKYRARAHTALLGYTEKNTEQIAIQFNLLDPIEGCPQSLTWYGYFTDAGTGIALKGMKTAGFKGDDVSDLSSLDAGVRDDLPEVLLVVEVEEYPKGSDKWQNKVAFVNSAGGVALKNAMTPKQASEFAARMKGKLVAFNQRTGTPPSGGRTQGNGAGRAPPRDDAPPPSDADAPPDSGEELPF